MDSFEGPIGNLLASSNQSGGIKGKQTAIDTDFGESGLTQYQYMLVVVG